MRNHHTKTRLELMNQTTYDHYIKRFNEWNRNQRITPARIIRYTLEYAGTGVKPSSVRILHICLKRAYFYAYSDNTKRQDDEDRHAFSRYRLPPKQSIVYHDKIPKRSDIERLLQSDIQTKYKLIIYFFYLTALRKAEALSIRLSECQIKDDSVYVDIIGKGNRSRRIYYPLELHQRIVQEFGSVHYLFESYQRKGHPLHPAHVSYIFRVYTEKVLGQNYSAHKFRHAFATEMLNRGAHMKSVSLWMGHASTSTTAGMYHHTILSPEDFRRILPEVKFA